MTTERTCPFCGIDTSGGGWTDGNGGTVCELCWQQRHPFRERETFREVIFNGEDQTLVYELLDAHLRAVDKAKIVMDFNATMSERYCKNLNMLLRERHEKESRE